MIDIFKWLGCKAEILQETREEDESGGREALQRGTHGWLMKDHGDDGVVDNGVMMMMMIWRNTKQMVSLLTGQRGSMVQTEPSPLLYRHSHLM